MWMHELDDNALLREFAERGSEPAFAALVTRHVNKVYSVALRHTRNPHQAEEITQAVFVILARKAGQLGKKVILSGWLYQTARLTAVTLIRSEIRRARREQEVLMQNLSDETEADPWPHIAPLLDDAMAGLSETDRHAVVLRYFDGKSMKEVGAALGGSEDAAKMRVNRAVEKLRTFFAKRGVALPAAALTTAIAAHSVQAAPAGLAAAVTTAALSGTAITTSAIIAATKTIVMTTLQKTLVTVTVAALAGTGIYEARQAAQLRGQNQTLQQSQAPLAEQTRQLQRERDDATNRLAGLADELAKANNKNLELLKLRGELGVLRQQTNELGRLRQENKKLLAQSAAQSDSTNLLSVEDQFTLRQTHVVDAMTTLLNAMKNYAAKHNGQYPGSFDQLIASGDLETSNLAGNLGLDDFELMKDGAVDPLGKKVMLSLRVPIQRTGKQSVIVFGGISDDGVTHTETMNVSSE
jgi:RNA polymerase sigma factor (sigma-70 family)